MPGKMQWLLMQGQRGGQRALSDMAAGETELKEVKVRLPVDQVLRLHYTRMTKRKNFSETVSTALTRYFDEFLEP